MKKIGIITLIVLFLVGAGFAIWKGTTTAISAIKGRSAPESLFEINSHERFFMVCDGEGYKLTQVSYGNRDLFDSNGGQNRPGHYVGSNIYYDVSIGFGILRELTHDDPELVDNDYPAWSIGGSKVAFSRRYFIGRNPDKYSNAQIWVMDDAGGRQRRLTNELGYDDRYPTWSYDDYRIAFLRYKQGENTNPRLMVMNADGTDLRELPSAPEMYQPFFIDYMHIVVAEYYVEDQKFFLVNISNNEISDVTEYCH